MKPAVHHLRTCIDKLPYIRHLRAEVDKQGRYRAGHYYSPIPAQEEILASIRSADQRPDTLPDVDMRAEHQSALLLDYAPLYTQFSPSSSQNGSSRYHYPNYLFDYADAFFLFSFLRKKRPKRIIEIGSGFSSALVLDSLDGYFGEKPRITFIEPSPVRLKNLLSGSDLECVELITEKVQNVGLDIFETLESGDLLFVDSSHQVKCGSDVLYIMFFLLPILPSGIFVHFHDVFYPFEYPVSWLEKGYFYNEAYFLRAFLAYNSAWTVHFFASYVDHAFPDILEERFPLCAQWPGSSLYIRKERL